MAKAKTKARSGQPQRSSQDGPVALEVREDGAYVLSVTHDGAAQSVVLGEYNAFRAFGMLGMLLGANAGVNLLSKAGETVQLSDCKDGRTAEMTLGYRPKNLGETIAANLVMQELRKLVKEGE